METINTTEIVSKDLIQLGYKVATNKKNTLDLPQFHSKGVGNSVPDLFFWNSTFEKEIFDSKFLPNQHKEIRAGFIELKTGDHIGELIDGVLQISRYYGYYITNKAIFSIYDKQIHNVDVFLLGTTWSRTGMLYKGDEVYEPKPIAYMSDRHNFMVPPYTHMLHSLLRKFKKMERFHIRNTKIYIPANKLNVDLGVVISKIPMDDNTKISDEYYAWMGNSYLPIFTKANGSSECIETKVRILFKTEKAIYIETKYQKQNWLPKSQIKLAKDINDIKIGEWTTIKVPVWLYFKKIDMFGII